MALIQCPACGNMVSEQAGTCPHCGHPIAAANNNNNAQVPQRHVTKGNNNGTIIGILGAIAAILAIVLIVVSGKGCTKANSDYSDSTSDIDSVSNTTTIVERDTVYVEKEPEVQQDVSSIPRNEPRENITPEGQFYVKSYGGNGVFLRYRPSHGATTKITYKDYTEFEGAYYNNDWIMVIEDGQCIGYLPAEKMYPIDSGDYDYAQ